MSKKILITGATGFVGGYIVEEAHNQGFEVFVTVRPSSNTEYIEAYKPQYIQPNLLDSASLHTALSKYKFDYIIHNAGITKAMSRQDYIDFNLGATQAMVDAINQLEDKPKLTFISSLAACGPADDKNGIIRPNSPNTPITYYGESKLLAEQYLQEKAAFEWSIIRPTAVYGPREKDLLTVFKSIHKGINAKVGALDKKLTFIFVKDLAKLIVATTLKGKPEIYLAAHKRHHSEDELAQYIKAALHKKTLNITIPMPLVKVIASVNELYSKSVNKVTILNKNKVNEIQAMSWVCDTTNTEKIYPITTTLEEGVEITAKWYKKKGWL